MNMLCLQILTTKLDPKYLVFYPGNKRVLKHRLVKFITKMTNQQTQTNPTNSEDEDEEEEDDFFQE